MRYLAADFGSTYTKLTAIDGAAGKVLGTACAFTTITTNIMDGFTTARALLHEQIGEFAHHKLLCCSSAGGGLAMIALGLVPDLTAKAAKMAAESAGAKVLKTYAYEISDSEQAEIYAANPDIVLLCGGTNGGNKQVIVNNARSLCAIDRDFFIIAAGNKSAERELKEILHVSGKQHTITQNVMPAFGTLDIEPAKECIRQIFIEKIIHAKGLSTVQAMTHGPIVPTPLAVLNACKLLSLGTPTTPGIGEFMAIDVGGATTDVYSMANGAPNRDNVLIKGLPEPYAKRTVEGDLGMRYSAAFLLQAAGAPAIAAVAGVSEAQITQWVTQCTATPETLAPQNTTERRMDEALARFAVMHAAQRHCGVMEQIYTPLGEMFTLTGKDLTSIPKVVGIGGVIKNSQNPATILGGAARATAAPNLGRMVPAHPTYCKDTQYILSAMGLVSLVDPELALTIMKQDIQPLSEG